MQPSYIAHLWDPMSATSNGAPSLLDDGDDNDSSDKDSFVFNKGSSSGNGCGSDDRSHDEAATVDASAIPEVAAGQRGSG